MSFIRRCDICGTFMDDGFVFDGGMKYYCDEPCLYTDFTKEEWIETYDDGNSDSYWTEWYHEDSLTYEELKEYAVQLGWEKSPSSDFLHYNYREMFVATLNLLIIKHCGNDSLFSKNEIHHSTAVEILNTLVELMDSVMKS